MSVTPILLSLAPNAGLKAACLAYSGLRTFIASKEHSTPRLFLLIQKVRCYVLAADIITSAGALFVLVSQATCYSPSVLYDASIVTMISSVVITAATIGAYALSKLACRIPRLKTTYINKQTSLIRRTGIINRFLTANSIIALTTHIACMAIFGADILHSIGVVLATTTIVKYFQQKWLQYEVPITGYNKSLIQAMSLSYRMPLIPPQREKECSVCCEEQPTHSFCSAGHSYHYICTTEWLKKTADKIARKCYITKRVISNKGVVQYTVKDIEHWQVTCPDCRRETLGLNPRIKIVDKEFPTSTTTVQALFK
jgi:hypothetical protein